MYIPNFEEIEKRLEEEKIIKKVPTLSIYEVVERTRKLIKKENNKNINCTPISAETKDTIQKQLKVLEIVNELIPDIKRVFLVDEADRKCVVNAFKMKKYRRNLNLDIEKVRKNRNKSISDIFDYTMWHDLSAKRNEVVITLNTLEQALPVIINNLNKNYIKENNDLIMFVTILEKRIYKLYSLYGYYLQDIGDLEEYNFLYQLFTCFDDVFKELFMMNKFKKF